jgi:protein transport protein SEC23
MSAQPTADFNLFEEQNGLRFTWNEWPSTDAAKVVVPVGCMITPMRTIEGLPPAVEYEPVRCKQPKCGAVLNPYCQVDFMSKHWVCPFCLNRNPFPQHYSEHISESNLPAELIPQFTTLEYQLPISAQRPMVGPPAFLYVVDQCLSEDELRELKDSIAQSLSLLPPNALVGLISFGTMVHIHELSSSDCPRSIVLKGTKDYDPSAVSALLGLGSGLQLGAASMTTPGPMGSTAQGGGITSGHSRFLMPVGECAYVFESILEDLQRDPWPKKTDQRAARCTGVALSVAVSLLERAIGKQGGRVMLFVGGPCTLGPGKVVDRDLKEVMRSHTDLQKGNAPHFQNGCTFYRTIADRMAGGGHCVDFFGCSGDQIGLLELRPCIIKSGGLCVLADSFGQSVFKESFRRVFRKWDETSAEADAGHLKMGFNATLEVICSRDYKVSGAIGPCSSLKRMNASVSQTEMGEGGTHVWSLGAITPSTTIALYFDMASQNQGGDGGGRANDSHFLQIITIYQHSSGRMRMRVTTTGGMWSRNPNDLSSLSRLFDQEAAAVMMARIAVHRTETEDPPEILRWLDRSLIRLCNKFADFRPNDPSSFRLGPNFSLFPQFMFHLRRSKFMQTFNTSPDEAAYYRLTLNREDVASSLTMIQPALIQYSFQGPPQPVLLDATSVKPDVILLLDDFFMVLLFHGETIAQWREQGYQDRPEHETFRQLLSTPREEAATLMEQRFPVPRYVVCDQHKSQARFLMSKVNPSVTHNQLPDGSGVAPVFTDDVSYFVFMEHLIKFSVSND